MKSTFLDTENWFEVEYDSSVNLEYCRLKKDGKLGGLIMYPLRAYINGKGQILITRGHNLKNIETFDGNIWHEIIIPNEFRGTWEKTYTQTHKFDWKNTPPYKENRVEHERIKNLTKF